VRIDFVRTDSGVSMRAITSLFATLLLAVGLAAPALGANVPAGFTETQFAGNGGGALNEITGLAWAPDGSNRLFITRKGGQIRIVKNGNLLGTPFATLGVRTDAESGALSLTFDPNFASNGRVYVFITVNDRTQRIVRLADANDDDVADAGPTTIVDNLPSLGFIHNGGGMEVGPDGMLYWSIGDNGDARVGLNGDLNTLASKVGRANLDGSAPSDNPFFTNNGVTEPRDFIFAMGVRNPFAMTFQPGTGKLWVNVAGDNYEQSFLLDRGNNAGDRTRENAQDQTAGLTIPKIKWRTNGQDSQGISSIVRSNNVITVTTNGRSGFRQGERIALSGVNDGSFNGNVFVASTPNQTTFTANQNGGNASSNGGTATTQFLGNAMVSGCFYNGSLFPAEFSGNFFLLDFGNSRMVRATMNGTTVTSVDSFLTELTGATDVAVGPDGALYYCGLNTGVFRLAPNAAAPAASRLAFGTQPSNATSGATINPPVTVRVLDAGGALVGNANNSVTLNIGANPAGGTLGGTRTVNAVNGVATFGNLSINNPGNGYTLTASSSGLTGVTSNTFNILATAATPVIEPGGGSFTGPVPVRIATATAGATIRFTTDGSVPNGGSQTFSAPFTLTANATVRAIAQRAGFADSGVATATFAINGNQPYGLAFRDPVVGVNLPGTLTSAPPATLSGTGLFANTGNLTPKAGIVPFTVNSPLWSDGAFKARFIALPGTSTIGFATNGEWTFPGGTVLVKHFEMNTDERNPAIRKRLETRVLMLDGSGRNGYGITYKWRADNSDADLLPDGLDETLTITNSAGVNRQQVWRYPSRGECLSCHTSNAGFVLGPKTRQLNGNLAYGSVTDNQIRSWDHIRLFSQKLDEATIPALTRTVPLTDTAASLETRVRSYLDSNCSFCHRPNGVAAFWDGRFDTALAQQGIVDGVLRNDLGIAGARVVVGQDVGRSIMHRRLNSLDPQIKMPPFAYNRIDAVAVNTLAQWIGTLQGSTPPVVGNGTGLTGTYFNNVDFTAQVLVRTDPTINFDFGTGSPDPRIDNTTYSVRWTGQVAAEFTQTYTFITTSDDGVRVTVNGQRLIDNLTDHAPVEDRGSIALTAGQKVDIVFEYFQGGGPGQITMEWESASTNRQVVPARQLFPAVGNVQTAVRLAFGTQPSNANAGVTIAPAVTVRVLDAANALVATANNAVTVAIGANPAGGTLAGTRTVNAVNGIATFGTLSINNAGNGYTLAASASGLTGVTSNAFNVLGGAVVGNGTGLTGTYFNNVDFTAQALVRTDATINFPFNGGSPAAGIAGDTFSVRWTGQVAAEFTQTYTFITTSDDGVRLTINGQRIIDNFTDHPPTEDRGSIALTAGQKVDLLLEYFQGNGGSEIRLEWESAGTARQVVPARQLFPAVVVQPPAALFAAKINFQPVQAPPVTGFLIDDGAVFAARNGLSYGWTVNNATTARDRNVIADQRFDTLQHMQKPENPNAVWEIAVPNGTYTVVIGGGDSAFIDNTIRVNAEGQLVLSLNPSDAVRFASQSRQVTVNDGRLTVTNGAGAANNKICFIEIQQVPIGTN